MKNILSLLAIILFGLSTQGQSGAKIEFKDKDNTVDYGTVRKETDNGIRFFEFTNTGDAPLIITNAQSTCGCTIPSFPKEPIMAGKSGKIEVKYSMAPGPIRKTITIETNAVNYEGGKVPLKIKGTVVAPADINLMQKSTPMPSN